MERLILDTETDGLDATLIHCVVTKNLDTGVTSVFLRPDQNPEAFNDYATDKRLIGHNIIGFDLPCLKRLVSGFEYDDRHCIDTVVISRLVHYSIPGGHSLDAWGNRLGIKKHVIIDWSESNIENIVARCKEDVRINEALYFKFEKYILSEIWQKALEIEHATAVLCRTLHGNGFVLATREAEELRRTIEFKLTDLDRRILHAFPPRAKLVREVHPRATKHGTLNRSDFRWLGSDDLSAYQPGAAFSVIEFQDFNPASPPQIVERLNESGWKPTEKTKSHIQAERDARRNRGPEARARLERFRRTGWKVSEENLGTLPQEAPEGAKALAQRIVLANRRSVLTEWLDAAEKDGRVHGTFYHIGAWTHRMSHANPNTANIPTRPDALLAKELRQLWIATKGWKLLGVDADAIQLRILAHLMEDEGFINALVSGVKETGTDAHSLNAKALGGIRRDIAKTFIYAWLLGAGTGKVAEILGCSFREAEDAVKKFLDFYPGLKYLRSVRLAKEFKQGYFQGVDGRYIIVPDVEHKVLSGHLQSGEAIVMKHSAMLWTQRLDKEKVPYRIVNFVHDEWQTEVPDEKGLPEYVAQIQADSIRQTGEIFGLKCPLLGTWINGSNQPTIGDNWYQTH